MITQVRSLIYNWNYKTQKIQYWVYLQNTTDTNTTHVFVWFDSLRPSQQSFSYIYKGLPGLNQY